MDVVSIQALSAYGSTAQSVTTPRQFRELLQMLRESTEADMQSMKVEFTQSTQKVLPIHRVYRKIPIKPEGHISPDSIDVKI